MKAGSQHPPILWRYRMMNCPAKVRSDALITLLLSFCTPQERTKADLPASSMKLIHSGKVLKDADEIGSCNIKPNDFLVVMIAKVS